MDDEDEDNADDDDGTSCRARSFSKFDTRRTNLNQNNNRGVIQVLLCGRMEHYVPDTQTI